MGGGQRIDAALAADSRFAYSWDAFGRLASAVSAAGPDVRLDFRYYPDGRRASKTVSQRSGAAWAPVREHRFHYDGWNLVCETVRQTPLDAASAPVTLARRYLWGPDLAGWRSGRLGQDAGCIGGLLAVTVTSNGVDTVFLPLTDGLGNVRGLVDAQTGALAAEYACDPYGAPLETGGPAAGLCPFRFQTKYFDSETGLYCFGYRYYDPLSCKWLRRDPKGEAGGVNLTAYCDGDPVNNHDPLGLANGPGDYGWAVYSASVGSFDDVRALRDLALGFEVPLPQRTTGAPAFSSDEMSAVWPMDGYDVSCGAQANAALWSIARLEALQCGGSLLRAKYGSLDSDTERVLGQGMSALNNVWDAWGEYARATGNVDPETGGLPARLNLRDLSASERSALCAGRVAKYQAAHPVTGLQSPGFDPVDIISGTVAARVAMGVAAVGVVSVETQKGCDETARILAKATHYKDSRFVLLGKGEGFGTPYYDIADRARHTHFWMPEARWNALQRSVGREGMWQNYNRPFIDQQWASDKEFLFSHDPWLASKMGPTDNFFAREVLRLMELGCVDFEEIPGTGLWRAIRP